MNEEKDRMTSRFGCVWQHILGYRHVDRDSKTSEGVLWNHLCHSFVCWETCFYNLIGGMGFLLSQFHETILIHSKSIPSIRYNGVRWQLLPTSARSSEDFENLIKEGD